MEGMQALNHRVPDGIYQAVLRWKVENGRVYVLEGAKWTQMDIEVRFVSDFPTPTKNIQGKGL